MAEVAEVEWRKLRADELRDMARADAIVILPVASLEQHGPHLPVEVDSMLGETVAVRAARKIVERGQSAIVLPVLWTGLSEHHMSFRWHGNSGLSRPLPRSSRASAARCCGMGSSGSCC